MPTRRPRHTITETDEIARALDLAAVRWPADRDNRAKLLQRLIGEGHRVVTEHEERRVSERRAAIERTSGSLTGVYPPGYLAELREDWPE